jgi:mannose-6-phosphate isomerase
MNAPPLYPLRFDPIYQYRVWGGRRLAELLAAPLPDDEPVGEAWLLSDRDDHASTVADGPLKGSTIRQLLEQSPVPMLGRLAGRFERFPVLLKFLDAREKLSVQVHPADARRDLIPAGESGKTEAWVVLEADPTSRIYAGLNPGTTRADVERAVADRTVPALLPGFTPVVGNAVFLPAGTVHSLGGLVVFEVQENSDVTFRLYDWDRVDPRTGQPRPLQVREALACIDYAQGVVGPVAPVVEVTAPACRERLFACDQFRVWRHRGEVPFAVGAVGEARVLVCVEGTGQLEHEGTRYAVGQGTTLLLPAVVGACVARPTGTVTLLEVALPDGR